MLRIGECGPNNEGLHREFPRILGSRQKKGLHLKICTNFHEFWDKKKGLQLKNCANFHKVWGKDQKKKVFISKYARISTNSGMKLQKKRVFIAKSARKQFLLTKSGVTTSILGVSGLKLHSSGTEPVTFFGAQFSFGGAQAVIWGFGPGMPPPPGAGSDWQLQL